MQLCDKAAFFAAFGLAWMPSSLHAQGCRYLMQGQPTARQIQEKLARGLDCNTATVAFPGISAESISPWGDCVYIDNSSPNTYFIPLKTQQEWDSFKTAVQVDAVPGVTMRGCH